MTVVSYIIWLFITVCSFLPQERLPYEIRYFRSDLVLSITAVVCACVIALGICSITVPKKD